MKNDDVRARAEAIMDLLQEGKIGAETAREMLMGLRRNFHDEYRRAGIRTVLFCAFFVLLNVSVAAGYFAGHQPKWGSFFCAVAGAFVLLGLWTWRTSR